MHRAFLVAFALTLAAAADAQVTLEYVGHACFALESPSGTRVVIDPFNSNRWLGYHFPEGIRADAVLVTHPHYDHDADYYFPERVPRFRLAGSYRVGDIVITGVRGKHADPYGREFGQQNTLWLVEVGGVRLAHLGDTGPLTAEMVAGLGRVDVLLTPVDDDDHILTRSQIAEIRQQLKPKLVIPMHYRLETVSDLPKSVGPITQWLREQRDPEILKSNRLTLTREVLDKAQDRVVALAPSPRLRPWRGALRLAWELAGKARSASVEGAAERALELYNRAHQMAPEVLAFTVLWCEAYADQHDAARVVDRLSIALASATAADREYVMRGRLLLAKGLLERGHSEAAARQARLVANNAWRHDLVQQAKTIVATE